MEAAEEKRLTEAEETILSIVPARFYKPLRTLMYTDCIENIRFRTDRPAQVIGRRLNTLLTQYDSFSRTEAKAMLERCCGHSVYAREKELCEGFVTVGRGSRIGICGNPLYSDGRITRFTDVTSFNIRIAREIKGCAERLMPLFQARGRPASALIASRPGVGKTTLLRDCARCFSDGIGIKNPVCAAVADERNELSGSIDGVPALDLGARTDVLAGIPKSIAMPMLIRSMAPDVIITDELSGGEEAECAAEAAKRGVAVIASVHAGSAAELKNKKWLREAMNEGVFKRLLLLERNGAHFTAAQVEV